MKKRKKVMLIVGIVLAVLVIAQVVLLGMFAGMGPFKGLQAVRQRKFPGNADAYSFDKIKPMEESPLKGKKVCILGSSVVFGAASMQYAVGEYVAARFDCDLTKEAVSGTTLADRNSLSYVSRMKKNLDKDAEFDLFICQLSTNDATKKVELGEISDSTNLEDFDTETVTGAIEYIINYVDQTWGCPVVFFTGSRYDSEAYGNMVEQLKKLQQKYPQLGVLDLWTENVQDEAFYNVDEGQRKVYMNDDIHPTMAGYRDWWGPEMERQLLAYLNR